MTNQDTPGMADARPVVQGLHDAGYEIAPAGLQAAYAAALPLLRRVFDASSHYPSGWMSLPKLNVFAGGAGLGPVSGDDWRAMSVLVSSVDSDRWAAGLRAAGCPTCHGLNTYWRPEHCTDPWHVNAPVAKP